MNDKNRVKRIVLDMDETTCSFVASCIEVCRQLWPEQQWKLPRYGRYSKWFQDFLTEEQREQLYAIIKTEEFYLNLPPMLSPIHSQNNTIETLSRVCWEHFEKVVVITARIGFCPNPEEVTRAWMKKHNFIDADIVTIIPVDGATCKTSVVKGPTLFVDDSVTVADAVSVSNDHHMIMVNHPWNDGYSRHSNIRVVPSRRIIESINSFKNGSANLEL